VEFFLRYQGPLPSGSGSDKRIKEKAYIRRMISPQLKDLWENHPGLNNFIASAIQNEQVVKGRGLIDPETNSDPLPYSFGHVSLRGVKFIPLVVRARRWICELKITFLRRHDPGDIVTGGDIDNRLKTLFDGLRIPYAESELPNPLENDDDQRCFCLLEDDALISAVSIETERLWGPLVDQGKESDVHILIRVTIKKHYRDIGFI
jgi:hypothetical protein